MEPIFAFMEAKGHCVLATRGADQAPWTSLMAYAVDAPAGRFVLVTLAKSRKAANILADPRVALLVDDRDDHPGAPAEALHALTVTGRAEVVTHPATRADLLARLLERHPGMAPFATRPDTLVLCVQARECQLLSGLEDALHFRYPEARP